MWAASSRGPLAPPGTLSGARDGRRPDRDAAVRDQARAAAAEGRHRSGSAGRVRSRDARSATRPARPTRRCCWCAASRRRSRIARASSTRRRRAVAKALDDFEAALSAIEGEIYQVKLQSSQDPLNFPIKLNNKIAALQGVIESADVRPTEQAYSVFRTLSQQPRRAARQAGHDVEGADAAGQSAAAAAEAGSDQGGAAEAGAAEACGFAAVGRTGGKGRTGMLRPILPSSPSCPAVTSPDGTARW